MGCLAIRKHGCILLRRFLQKYSGLASAVFEYENTLVHARRLQINLPLTQILP